MDRINGANTVDIGGGRRGWRARNLGAGIAGTQVTAPYQNASQEELIGIIEAAGLVPDELDWGQVLAALRILFPGRGQLLTFTASGTFVVPAGVHRIRARCWGGGASGGAGTGGGGGGGGGAGGYAEGWYDVTPGASIPVTVPAAAAGSASAGNPGGTASLGTLLSATGGLGGNPSAALGSPGAGGAGGIGVGGQFNWTGANGQSGQFVDGNAIGGPGGGAFAGGMSPEPSATGALPGVGPGGGSSGGATTASIAAQPPLVIVEW